ncbi:sterol carrier family protein [Acaricomes phytoseiuli]|uniref:sterol carrier family protein n=1 Tax=Acaricomes phytoseiuli TaxID=291968 RepID=UPI00036CB0C7|nr:sterol carrier family protein [Acaricomes phytoseiuli]MCW1248873.1 sterol carrier family protein [Acaricomes phytoseiuli]
MPARRRIDPQQGAEALQAWQGGARDRQTLATAVRYALTELAERTPGNSVEVRVPPYGVAQCIPGPRHTRGTPPNIVETDAETWLAMVIGLRSWRQSLDQGRITASGTRADLSEWLPLWSPDSMGSRREANET